MTNPGGRKKRALGNKVDMQPLRKKLLQVHWNILKQESENTGIIHSIKLNKAIMSIYPTSQIVFQGSQRFLGWKAFWRLPTKYVLLQVSSVEVAWKVFIVISLFAVFYNDVLIIHVYWFNLVGITCDLMKDHIAGMCCSFNLMLFLQWFLNCMVSNF